MSANTFVTTVNGVSVACNPNLQGFKIMKKESSNVDYFATYPQEGDKSTGQLFIQFLTGKCYVYMNVPNEVLELAEDHESIGKYFYKFIKGKYPEQEVEDRCIVPTKSAPDEEDEEDWDPDEEFDLDLDV